MTWFDAFGLGAVGALIILTVLHYVSYQHWQRLHRGAREILDIYEERLRLETETFTKVTALARRELADVKQLRAELELRHTREHGWEPPALQTKTD
jgi:hypothetical protein